MSRFWPAGVDRAALAARALFCMLALAVAALLSSNPAVQGVDSRIHDVFTTHVPKQPAPSGVLVVDISEASLAALGPWPWPRSLLTEISLALRQRGARVQVWDVMLPEGANGDDGLAATLSRPDVVMGQALVIDSAVGNPPRMGRLHGLPTGKGSIRSEPYAGLCSSTSAVRGYLGVAESLRPAAVGHVSSTPDADGRLRRLPAVVCHDRLAHAQLALVAAEAATPQQAWSIERGIWPWDPPVTLVRGGWSFPLDDQGWMRVPYARPHGEWRALSVEQILDPSSQIPELNGAIVVVGSTALGLADVVSTPYHPVAPGVAIHAELLGAAAPASLTVRLGQSQPRWVVDPQGKGAWSIALVLILGALLTVRLSPQAHTRQIATVSGFALLAPFVLAYSARIGGWNLSITPIVAAVAVQITCSLLFNLAWLRRQSLVLAHHLQGFMPRALAMQVAARNTSSDSLGHADRGVILAIRVEGLQRWQDSVSPLQALGVIHALHAAAQGAASAAEGRLEQVQGQTLFLVWPVREQNDAASVARALVAARRCVQELSPVLQQNESDSYPLSMNMALEFGSFLHGVVGHSDSRRTILLGPVVSDVQAMLDLSGELASPVILGPNAASLASAAASADTRVQRIGDFVLPEHAMAESLFRVEFPLHRVSIDTPT
jgi:adenylate cyclase